MRFRFNVSVRHAGIIVVELSLGFAQRRCARGNCRCREPTKIYSRFLIQKKLRMQITSRQYSSTRHQHDETDRSDFPLRSEHKFTDNSLQLGIPPCKWRISRWRSGTRVKAPRANWRLRLALYKPTISGKFGSPLRLYLFLPCTGFLARTSGPPVYIFTSVRYGLA